MRKSNRFGLNLVEGSDIVNPLVQDVPNYEIIDEEMGRNADNGIPLATELLTGTVHSLTRENPDAPMFRFVATANYKSGDTFTVDGVQVTALLTTGEPLATGCYVINSNVLCCLVGTVLTMFCANSLAEIHAVDSDKLGGKDAALYAKVDDVVECTNLAQSANTISLSNQVNITKLEEKCARFCIDTLQTDVDFGNINAYGSSSEITFAIKIPERTLGIINYYRNLGYGIGVYLGCCNAPYGGIYSYYMSNSLGVNEETITFRSKALNNTNAAHKCTARLHFNVFAYTI